MANRPRLPKYATVKLLGHIAMKQLAEAIRLLRVFHDLSQTELAARLNVSKSYLSELEAGKKEPTLDLLSRYAAEFQIPLSSLFFFVEKASQNSYKDSARKIAPKVIKLLDWIAATQASSSIQRKPVARDGSLRRKLDRLGA